MNKNLKLSVIILGIAFAFSFSSCERIKFDEDENASIRDARNALQEYETDGGDFVFLKSLLGRTNQEAIDYVEQNGYVEDEGQSNSNRKVYYDAETDTISKYLYVQLSSGERIQNAEMMVKNNDPDTLFMVFKKWLLDMRYSSSYPLLVRENYKMSNGWYSGYQYFDTPEQLLVAAESIYPQDSIYIYFSGNDNQAYAYQLLMDYRSAKTVYMNIQNFRVNNPLPDVPTVTLTDEYLDKDILIAKVDYVTFEYEGFYSMNVTNKLNEGNEIPFLMDYVETDTYGHVKIYYRDESNLLMYGDKILMGTGELHFPDTFVKGGNIDTYVPEYTMKHRLEYPGNDRISYIDNNGIYTTDINPDFHEPDLRYIWQTLSECEEFMSFFERTTKKVAVYPYTNGYFYDWSYFVFVER